VSIPDDHLQRLEADLAVHEARLRTLRLQIALIQDEVSAHERIVALGRDPEVLRVVHELCDQPELAERIAQDPPSFFEERGIQVPDEATVTVTTDPPRSAIEAHFVTPTLEYGVGWARRDGFYLIQSPRDADHASD
jgi:hypothetical protein